MLIQHHAIIGAVSAAIFYPLFGVKAALIIAAAVLLDADHYLIYIYRHKNLNLKKAYNFFIQVKDGSEFYPLFHMVEIAAIGAFISNYYSILLPLVIGQVIHIAQDWFEDMFLRTTNRNFFIVKLLIGE